MARVGKQIGKRPTKNFEEILNVARFCSNVVGLDVADPNYRFSFMTLVSFSVVIFYFTFTFMTIIKTFAENWMLSLEATCMIGSVVQAVVKLITGLAMRKRVPEIRFLLEGLYEEYEKKGPEYCEPLNRCSASVRRVIVFVGVIYLISDLAIITTPLLIHATSGRRYLIMHFMLPGLDVATDFGYFATLSVHITCMVAGGFGHFAGDVFALLFFTQCYFFVDIFKLKVKELNALLETEENRNSPLALKALEDLVQWHQLYMRYTELNNNFFFYIVTTQVTTAGISIVITIFIFLTSEWPGAYPYLVLPILALYLYCILGTKIEICNDEFCYEIYNISWYNLNAREQKIIALMLMKSQTPNVITVAGFMPLSVGTGLQISKTIYSISMMIVQFVR